MAQYLVTLLAPFHNLHNKPLSLYLSPFSTSKYLHHPRFPICGFFNLSIIHLRIILNLGSNPGRARPVLVFSGLFSSLLNSLLKIFFSRGLCSTPISLRGVAISIKSKKGETRGSSWLVLSKKGAGYLSKVGVWLENLVVGAIYWLVPSLWLSLLCLHWSWVFFNGEMIPPSFLINDETGVTSQPPCLRWLHTGDSTGL